MPIFATLEQGPCTPRRQSALWWGRCGQADKHRCLWKARDGTRVGRLGEAFLEKKVASLNAVIPLQTFLSLGDCSPVSTIWTRPGRKFFSRYPLSVKSGCMNQRHHFPSNRFNASGSKGLPMCSFMPAFRLSARSVFMALAVMAMIGRALKRLSFRINRVA